MKLYRVSCPLPAGGEAKKWVGTQADAAKARAELAEKYGAKRKQISTEEIEVPTKKDELIAWLNERGV